MEIEGPGDTEWSYRKGSLRKWEAEPSIEIHETGGYHQDDDFAKELRSIRKLIKGAPSFFFRRDVEPCAGGKVRNVCPGEHPGDDSGAGHGESQEDGGGGAGDRGPPRQ